MYDPKIGQFLSEDPIEFEGNDPNIRRYVFNNPVSFTDPTGLSPLHDASTADGDLGYGHPTPRVGEWTPFEQSVGMTWYPQDHEYQLLGQAWLRINADNSVDVVGELFVREWDGFTWMATPNAAELALWNWKRTKDDKYLDDPCLKGSVGFGQQLALGSIINGLRDPRGQTERFGRGANLAILLSPPVSHPGLGATTIAKIPNTRGSSTPRPAGWNPALTRISRSALHIQLRDQGFTYHSTTKGGYVEYRHVGGNKVWIRPNGEIIRFGQKIASSDGGKLFHPRIDASGRRITTHCPGEFTESLPNGR